VPKRKEQKLAKTSIKSNLSIKQSGWTKNFKQKGNKNCECAKTVLQFAAPTPVKV
jgi:hypothetical protein